jgi:hypothetical protein
MKMTPPPQPLQRNFPNTKKEQIRNGVMSENIGTHFYYQSEPSKIGFSRCSLCCFNWHSFNNMYVYTVHIYNEYKLHVEVLKLKKKKEAEMVSNLFE